MMNEFDQNLKKAGISRSFGYSYYFKNYIFKDVDLNNKKIIDIGGGNGIASFYAINSSPTCSAWVVDPIAEGSNNSMLNQYENLKKLFNSNRIVFHRDFLETLEQPKMFDIIIMHNSINHVGESLIKDVLEKKEVYDEFKNIIKNITTRLCPNGILIISDCGKFNFLGNLGLINPIAPTIDWSIHLEPEFWQKMIMENDFSLIKTEWTARRELGSLGKKFLANRLCSYFLNSHFVSVYKKNK